jgi:hypothetical protein
MLLLNANFHKTSEMYLKVKKWEVNLAIQVNYHIVKDQNTCMQKIALTASVML